MSAFDPFAKHPPLPSMKVERQFSRAAPLEEEGSERPMSVIESSVLRDEAQSQSLPLSE